MDGIMRICVQSLEIDQLISKAHYGTVGGRFSTNKIAQKILRARL